ncbi:hypothetical protein C0V82_14735 [Niveispirillum cyanobacteriorum]|uniref:Uncharacterized protein n=1 Tax=Niveispirillum cyanobacteriorum TaxID=1612173 RepID=A0A2K9NEC9_9PROT|nr:hypothetical protein C0V82_14735 [Niveispirillum cyanobacteriorum]
MPPVRHLQAASKRGKAVDEKVCFVIMGFGKKLDPASGRLLDLNKTYECIIKPAVERAGMRCVRADEVMHSGLIDNEMYSLLLKADLVIADISTGNPNALYELGVRHTMRPYSTIIMKELDGNIYFDLSHNNIFQYKHMGDDIGYSEAIRAQVDLKNLIEEVMSNPKNDSPVYTYIPNLTQPILSSEQMERVIERMEKTEEIYQSSLGDANSFMRQSDFSSALKPLSLLHARRPNDPYIVQQLALATYKSKQPSIISSLVSAREIINKLEPDNCIDPETLGIAGSINKRLYSATDDESFLNQSIFYYRRGYEVRRDYYNGENYATCLLLKSKIQKDKVEKRYYMMSAQKIFEEVLLIVSALEESDFSERSDAKWIMATKLNCLRATNADYEKFKNFEDLKSKMSEWEYESFLEANSFIGHIVGGK